jgi:hypothetical protein
VGNVDRELFQFVPDAPQSPKVIFLFKFYNEFFDSFGGRLPGFCFR